MRLSTALLPLLIPLSACQISPSPKNVWRVYSIRFEYDHDNPTSIRTKYFQFTRTAFQHCYGKRSLKELDARDLEGPQVGDSRGQRPANDRPKSPRDRPSDTPRNDRSGCNVWKHVDNTIGCQQTCSGPNGWHSCSFFSPSSEGEGNLSDEQKARLKYKVVDVKMQNGGGPPFKSITWQIVNTVKPTKWAFSSELADTTDVRTFVANFTVTPEMTNCGGREKQVTYMCDVLTAGGFFTCKDRDADCRVNAPVTESVLKLEEFERKYWPMPPSWSAKVQSCPNRRRALNWETDSSNEAVRT